MNDRYREEEQAGCRVRQMEDHIRVEYPDGLVREDHPMNTKYHKRAPLLDLPENPLDGLARYAIAEDDAGRTRSLRRAAFMRAFRTAYGLANGIGGAVMAALAVAVLHKPWLALLLGVLSGVGWAVWVQEKRQ